ncbi:calcium/sodium antiporter [Moraxellaceae bacterium AER2_44_116]|nr:calcium/sodium antiporter [Moraxellaceae bacterium]TQC97242.1 calcium/sodium antiporter [Moraxellaceae bacterium AER2_44_116]
MELMTLLLLLAGLVLLTFGADVLVKGASSLAGSLGISPLIIGLTVVAFGTSAPEMSVSVSSAFKGAADIAVGNVVGSNICNVLLILGLSAIAASLVVQKQLVRFDIPIMIYGSLIVLLMGIDGVISRIDGLLLFLGIIAYTIFLIKEARREGVATVDGVDDISPPQPLWKNIISIVVGLVMLVLGSQWLVEGAVEIAKYFGLSELVIGLTIVAVGTSLPELATSVLASLKGERDIAVGNILGSNIFNIGAVLGLSGLIAPNGLPVAQSSLIIDIPVMILVALACLPVFLANYTVTRFDGVAFLVCYVVYVLYVVLAGQQSAMLATILPFLLIIVAVCVTWWMLEVVRYLRRQA